MTYLIFFVFSVFLSQLRAADLSFRTALQSQDANNPELTEALSATTVKIQKSALIALTKISTNTALQNLIEARAKILPTNIRQYCNALGQKYLIGELATGFAIDEKLREQATTLLAELSVGPQAPSHCFEGFAKLSTRAHDAKVEELFQNFQIEKLEVRKAMSPQNISQILLALYFHRLNTFDSKAPADRYWFSSKFKAYVRAIPLDRNPEMLVRQSWARVAYLSNDDLVLEDYSKLLQDSDVVSKVISLDLINFVDKTNVKQTLTALKNENHRVVYAALKNLVRLGKTEVLHPQFKGLLAHPQKQVRRAMLSVVGEKLTLAEITPFLQDSSNGVQQVAVKFYLKLRPEARLEYSAEVFAGADFGLKKGVLDSSSEFTDSERAEVFSLALSDQNIFIKNYTLGLITAQKLTSLYPEALKYLSSQDPDQRIEAIKVLLQDKSIEQRMMKIFNVYTSSQNSMYEYSRDEIINYFISTTDQAEQAMLVPLLAIESNWRFANRLGEAIVKLGLGVYTPRAPEFEVSEAEKYVVKVTHPLVKIVTTQGPLVFELFNDVAPLHVSSFLYNVEKGLLNKNFFHRVEDNFVVQASRPFVDGRQEPGSLPAEILGLRQSRGTLAMPRNEYLHSGQGENFYINLSSNFGLNTNYTVFGKLIAGEAVLDQLEIGDSVLEVIRLN